MTRPFWTIAVVLGCLSAGRADAAFQPGTVHVADSKKTQFYVLDGLIVGGDRTVEDVVVRDIRRAANAGYERLVIDLEGNKNGESIALQRPPYFQVAVTPDEKRLVFTIWGHPKLGFDSRKVQAAFRKSSLVSKVDLLPRVEEDLWTFSVELKGGSPVEVFELANPIRIIVDIRSGFSGHKR